jgi:hypothetical protein
MSVILWVEKYLRDIHNKTIKIPSIVKNPEVIRPCCTVFTMADWTPSYLVKPGAVVKINNQKGLEVLCDLKWGMRLEKELLLPDNLAFTPGDDDFGDIFDESLDLTSESGYSYFIFFRLLPTRYGKGRAIDPLYYLSVFSAYRTVGNEEYPMGNEEYRR